MALTKNEIEGLKLGLRRYFQADFEELNEHADMLNIAEEHAVSSGLLNEGEEEPDDDSRRNFVNLKMKEIEAAIMAVLGKE